MKMKKSTLLLAVLAACAGLEGCALTPEANAEPHAERTYITGSNIARKQHSGEVSIISQEEYVRARSGITPPIPTMPGGAH